MNKWLDFVSHGRDQLVPHSNNLPNYSSKIGIFQFGNYYSGGTDYTELKYSVIFVRVAFIEIDFQVKDIGSLPKSNTAIKELNFN